MEEFNNKAKKEARNLIAYAKMKTADFKVNMDGLLVGYKYKDTPYAANRMLGEEIEKSGQVIYFEPCRINSKWRNARLRMRKVLKVKPQEEMEQEEVEHK